MANWRLPGMKIFDALKCILDLEYENLLMFNGSHQRRTIAYE